MTWLEYNEALQELRPDSEVVIGTGAQASWRLRHADLMPRHFIVVRSDEGTKIRPFSSDTIVSVNGRQLPTGMSSLQDGDVIAAGAAEFYFWAASPGETRRVVKTTPTAHLIDTRRRSALSLHRISTGIGRDESNVLVLDDEGASSFHAEVRREAGGHALRASDATLIRVNGRPVSAPVLLNEGDEIQIASLLLRYTREPLPEGMESSVAASIPTEDSVGAGDAKGRAVKTSPLTELSSALTLRTPMRAVAFVSSVIAAVAIATLVFLHRGP
ncbi:MAG TPA: FHA domain-containing protein [Gemmatimonadaceae bacterium]|nr:FHA domain-containing protein [Gemmatimonadaceae bacterium]